MTERDVLLWALKGDVHAVLFVESVFRISQIWDDLIDKDVSTSDKAINDCFRESLTGIPRNLFFRAHVESLLPIMDSCITDWISSNTLEKGSEHDRSLAFVLRDSLAALVIHCAMLLGGHEWAEEVAPQVRRQIHDETLSAFLRST